MSRIVINGVEISGDVSGGIIVVQGNRVIVGDRTLHISQSETVHLEVSGDLLSVESDGAVTVNGDVHRDVKASGSISCRNVGGNARAGGAISCGDITGKATAGGAIVARNIRE